MSSDVAKKRTWLMIIDDYVRYKIPALISLRILNRFVKTPLKSEHGNDQVRDAAHQTFSMSQDHIICLIIDHRRPEITWCHFAIQHFDLSLSLRSKSVLLENALPLSILK